MRCYEQTKLWKKVFTSSYNHQVTDNHWGKSRQELKQGGTWRQELKERPVGNAAYWLALRDLLSLLSHTSQDYLSRGGTVSSGLGPHTHSNHKSRKCLTGLPRDQSDGDGGTFSTGLSSSQKT